MDKATDAELIDRCLEFAAEKLGDLHPPILRSRHCQYSSRSFRLYSLPIDVARHVVLESIGSHHRAGDLLLLERQVGGDHRDRLADRHDADEHGRAAPTRHLDRLFGRRDEADAFEDIVRTATREVEHGLEAVPRAGADDVGAPHS